MSQDLMDSFTSKCDIIVHLAGLNRHSDDNAIYKTNVSLAEKLVGHSVTVPLDNSYHKPLLERLFVEYQKHIPQLIINEKYRLELELEKSKNKDDEIANLKNTILEIKYNMLELQNKIKS